MMEQYITIPERLKAVYNRLQDDESRMIFNGRLQYFLDSNPNLFIKNVVCPIHEKLKLNRVVDELKAMKANGREIICYGAGVFGRNISTILNYYGLGPDYFCDTDVKKQQLASIKIISPDELFSNHRESMVIIGTWRYLEEIRGILFSGGFKKDDIYDQFAIEEGNGDENYWHHSFFSPVPNEIYIDGGVFDCGSIKHFIKFAGEYNKIYGFEPSSTAYSQCLQIIKSDNLMRIEMINKGLWSEETTLRFNDTGNGNARIDNGGTDKIAVSTIDKSVGTDCITFIKMDIEGAELEALKGAKETILHNKPRLAICVYHKPEDILEIPLYLSEIVPEYKFWLRHETPGMGQTVLYAVAEKI